MNFFHNGMRKFCIRRITSNYIGRSNPLLLQERKPFRWFHFSNSPQTRIPSALHCNVSIIDTVTGGESMFEVDSLHRKFIEKHMIRAKIVHYFIDSRIGRNQIDGKMMQRTRWWYYHGKADQDSAALPSAALPSKLTHSPFSVSQHFKILSTWDSGVMIACYEQNMGNQLNQRDVIRLQRIKSLFQNKHLIKSFVILRENRLDQANQICANRTFGQLYSRELKRICKLMQKPLESNAATSDDSTVGQLRMTAFEL